ncbi:hypothetical protein J132_09681, partial [Termitomyces sp. J132]
INPAQTDWVQKLPTVEFTINLARSESMGYSPFFLNHGCMPWSIVWNTAAHNEYAGVRVYAQQLHTAIMAAHDSILATQVKQIRLANHKRRAKPSLKET